jgi:hypothetical protein
MYVSQLLSKEIWSKSPEPNERVYKAGINPILQILNQRYGLNVQTPMHESTMQIFFCEILIFFSFSSGDLR